SLTYKHRGEIKGSEIAGFGDKWSCNWLGMLQSQSSTPDVFTNILASGGVRAFQTDGTPEYTSGRTLAVEAHGGGGASTPSITSSTGSKTKYSFSMGYTSGNTNYFPT